MHLEPIEKPALALAKPSCCFVAGHVTDFLATSDGVSLVKAFMLVEDPKLRRAIVRLVEEIAPATGEFGAPAADHQDK
jgi:hypothetical protein